MLTPLTLELTLALHEELQARFEQADRLRHKAVERAQYEADLARRRYLRVEIVDRGCHPAQGQGDRDPRALPRWRH